MPPDFPALAAPSGEEDAATSLHKTDAALGLVREFVPVSTLVTA